MKVSSGLLILVTFLIIGGCKAGPGGEDAACDPSVMNCSSSKPNGNLAGRWVSTRSQVDGPMTYYKGMVVGFNQIKFSQICARNDGRIVTATISLQVEISDSSINVTNGGEREEFTDGISCTAQIERGLWSYKLDQATKELELSNERGTRLLRFIKRN